MTNAARPRRAAAASAAAGDRLPRARRHACRASSSSAAPPSPQQATAAEQHHQVAARQRQGLPREARHRHQLLRSRQRAPAPPPIRRPARHAGAAAPPHNLPSAGAIASSGGAIVSQTFKLLLGTVSAVGNFFIVLFLGLAFAAQPGVYRNGLLFMAPARHRARATVIIDRIGETLERWLIAQIITMFAVFVVTWIGLAIIGIQSSFILGIQAGLLTFIPTVGALIGGVDRGAGEPRLGMGRRRCQRVRPVPRRARAGKLRPDADPPAPGAGHSARHAVRVPDPARRRVRHLGPGAGVAADGDRQGHDRSFQGR